MVNIVIGGSKGKMGLRIAALAKSDAEIEISGEFDVGVDAEPLIANCDCLIEFTAPEATIEHLSVCEKMKKAIVIGTTGLSEAHKARITEASANIPVVFSPNMSIGVNALFKIVADAVKLLGPDYTAEILEAHHIHKKDSPSGTAKELAGIIKAAKFHKEVHIESVREGEIVGEHTVTFESPFDTLELTHSAKTRDVFAKGALTAAKWIAGKKPGLYSMKDVLGI